MRACVYVCVCVCVCGEGVGREAAYIFVAILYITMPDKDLSLNFICLLLFESEKS